VHIPHRTEERGVPKETASPPDATNNEPSSKSSEAIPTLG
jgi:hypothetical protein